MTTYSPAERLQAITKAGFANPLTALSVSLAEFGASRDINVQAQSDVVTNGVREPSFGPWQIHLPSHPSVTQSCAMDLTCSTAKAFEISKGGTDFGAWSAYNNGGYKKYLDELMAPIQSLATPSPSSSTGGGGGTTASASSSPSAATCGLDALSIFNAGEAIKRGNTPAQVAADMTKSLGRPITVECLQGDAYKVATAVGAIKIPGEDLLKGVGGLTSFTDLLKGENLWRAAFVVLGAALVFSGARLYLHEPEGVKVNG